MNIEALIITGKLEARLGQHENLLKEVANLQKFIEENDYAKLAISFGRLSELIQDCGIDVSENMQALYKIISEGEKILQEEQEIAKEEKKLNTPLRMLDFSVRTHNCLERANIRTVRDLTELSEFDLMRIRNLGTQSKTEVIHKLEELGLKLKSQK